MHDLINQLKDKHLIWQGYKHSSATEYLPTGFDTLDEKLGGGFPRHGVVEIQSQLGIGELRLLSPHIKSNRSEKVSVFIHPPGQVSAEQLSYVGIEQDKVLIIIPSSAKEALWAAEQCLKSGVCSNVLLWHCSLEVHQARRLQVASEQGDCVFFIFKTWQRHTLSLPVSLSMTLLPHPAGLSVRITKRKGGWPQGSFVVDMQDYHPELTLAPTQFAEVLPLRKQG